MDPITHYNHERWEALAKANIEYSRPMLNLTPETARQELEPFGVLGSAEGKRVLCLASGGGQQSAAFGLLGARVTVRDFSETQLERDRQAAAHYGLHIETLQGDMRDLSPFADRSFDIVYHAHSINFIPDVEPVFSEVARVLAPGGLYRFSCMNPFVHGLDERHWDGHGYPLWRPYIDGDEVIDKSPWDVWQTDGSVQRVAGPHEFRHTLSGLVNGLVRHGFNILGLWEEPAGDPNAQPGTWQHYKAIAPPWLVFWTRLQ
ncbi:MAG TPA: class I SAM-dependent methyltransferase [Anaerolineae bacterium]